MTRANNVVTVNTALNHNLQVGYQVQISGVLPSFGSGGAGLTISSIVIKNENLAGIAVVTTSTAHGLSPGTSVIINSVNGVTLGVSVSAIRRAGGVLVVTATGSHGLSPGGVVTITDATLGTIIGAVFDVTSATVFTILQPGIADATGAGAGSITLAWPIPDTATPQYFEVVAAPTSTTFQIALNYTDGTWTSGQVLFPWEGIFFVSAVPSVTQFQYQQYGPDATSNTVGTVTPYGQAAPGIRQMVVLFLTRQGFLTKPSPPIQFVTNGAQYISVGNIPIGPSNVVARILAFTGALGAQFFYIPTPAQVNGQQVSTGTQINDNTTTNVLLDFSDNTLFASLGISIPGNTPANQIVLDGALGFGLYASRLITWGQRNKIQNLLNMGFEGGDFPATPTLPCGWLYTGASSGHTGNLTAGHFGLAWQMVESGAGGTGAKIEQSLYLDAYGNPILTPNTVYRFRAWINPSTFSSSLTVFVYMTSVSASIVNGFGIAMNTVPTGGGFVEMAFPSATPSSIPSDMILQIYCFNATGAAQNIIIDDMSIIFNAQPFLEQALFGSYVDNPEAFDGLSGKFGSSQDTHKVMDIGDIRQTLYILTQDPSGRLHQTSDNGVTEPAGWRVDQVAANCGLLSAFALTKSQADDSSAAGGEEWMAWASSSGARIFGGDYPNKISQEIQPDWDKISATFRTTTWALNDPVGRKIYFGLPQTGGGAPSKVYVMDYRELDSAYQIAASSPIHTSFTGRLVATDHTRKWSPWAMTMNGAALMYRAPGALSVVLFTGNGFAPGSVAGNGQVYTLDPTKLTDDDFGQIFPYYTTYFFPTHDQEQGLKLDGGRKMISYVSAFASGVGQLQMTFLCDALTNSWPLIVLRQMQIASLTKYDMEGGGGSATAQRIAIKFASGNLGGTDNSFSLQKVNVWMKKATHLPVRGAV